MRYKIPQGKYLPALAIFAALLWFAMHGSVQIAQAQPPIQTETGTEILEVAWSPDGAALAVATASGVRIYDQQLQQLTALYPERRIDSVTWSPDGDRLAFSNYPNVEIWAWDSSSNQAAYEALLDEAGLYYQVRWSPGGSWLAAFKIIDPTQGRGLFYVWDMERQQLLSVSTDEYLIRLAAEHQDVFDWNPLGEPLLIGVGHGVQVEGENIITTTDLVAYIIDIYTGDREVEIPLAGPYATSVAWHPDGDLFAVGGDVSLGIYSSRTEAFLRSFLFIGDALTLDWDPSGRYIVGGSGVGGATTGQFLGYFSEATGSRTSRWHPDGILLAMGAPGGTLYLSDPGTLPGFEFSPIARATAPDLITDSDGNGFEQVTIDASASADPDGVIISYTWTEEGAEIATGTNPQVELAVGEHHIRLTVTDDDHHADMDEVVITVE